MRFLSRSILILLVLWGIVFALGDAYLVRLGAPSWTLITFPIFTVGLQFLLGPWVIEWFLDIVWETSGSLLPAANREFLERVCAERGIKVPRVGIIYSGTPNAFCFGHFPGNARLVVTKGLLDVLTPDEVNAVLAHELGHLKHWDFVVMTFASLAPLLLYQIYVVSEHVDNIRAVGYGAYLCYWVSQFIVLLLNRTREYYADNFSSQITQAPDTLASALIKIAYGLVRAEGEYRESLQSGYDKERKAELRRERRLGGAIGLMGISNFRAGQSLALGVANPTEAAAVMRWDLVNPWARFYQLNSTHPLTALRVRELNRDAEAMGQASRYPLPQGETVRWGLFPLEVFLWAAPTISLVVLGAALWEPGWLAFLNIQLSSNAKAGLLIFSGLAWMLRTLFRYHGEFQEASVGHLIKDIEVSQMRTRAVRLKGKIVGKGVPGFFWSSDLVLQDPTGIIFVLYRQSIPFVRFWFAFKAENLIGEDVDVIGWFRRGGTPYVEMSCLIEKNGTKHRTYSRWVQHALAVVALVAGWVWLRGI